MDVCLQRRQEFRLKHHGLEIEPLEGIALDYLHDRRREEFANIAEPAGDARRGSAEPSSAAGPAPRAAITAVIERRERAIDALVALRESARVVTPEHQAPAAAALILRCCGVRHGS